MFGTRLQGCHSFLHVSLYVSLCLYAGTDMRLRPQVRLVKRKADGKVYAMKTMIKESMVMKNQVSHVRAERDVMAKAKSSNRWLTQLLFSFQDDSNLHLVMEFLPGGDVMSLLIREDTFSEEATKFYMVRVNTCRCFCPRSKVKSRFVVV